MSGRRYRFASALAVFTALLMAVPALAGNEGVRARSAAVRAFSAPTTPQMSATHYGAGPVVWARYYSRPFGFYSAWGPFWYPGPWWYGWPEPEPAYTLQPAVPKDQVLVTLHITPSKADVTVDGKTQGKARDFGSVRQPLWLKPGEHVIEIGRAGYQTLRLALELDGGHGYDLSYGLNKGQGLDARSSGPAQTPGTAPVS